MGMLPATSQPSIPQSGCLAEPLQDMARQAGGQSVSFTTETGTHAGWVKEHRKGLQSERWPQLHQLPQSNLAGLPSIL